LPPIGHKSTVYEYPATVIQAKRRIYIKAGLPLVGGEEMTLSRVIERAFHPDRPIFLSCQIRIGIERRQKVDRRHCHAFLDRGDQTFLPDQTLDLPRAETDQYDESNGRKHEDRPQPLPSPLGRDGRHRLPSNLPSAALLAYCCVNNTPLNKRKATWHSATASGIHRMKCSQAGGPYETSIHSARAPSMKPMTRITNTAGPSPESANE